MLKHVAVWTLAFCLVPSLAGPQEKQDTRNLTLKNIRGCEVVVERLNASAVAFGLGEEQLKLDAEQKLRAAGIGVGRSFSPMLAVNVTFLLDRSRTGVVFGYSAYVEIEFWQGVTIEANGLKDFAVTWKKGLIISGQNNAEAKEQIRSTLRTLVDGFIQAYRAANTTLKAATDYTD